MVWMVLCKNDSIQFVEYFGALHLNISMSIPSHKNNTALHLVKNYSFEVYPFFTFYSCILTSPSAQRLRSGILQRAMTPGSIVRSHGLNSCPSFHDLSSYGEVRNFYTSTAQYPRNPSETPWEDFSASRHSFHRTTCRAQPKLKYP